MMETKTEISENIQMYLVNIFRLREGDKPVPVPALVEEMGITSASVNEMCRKLEKAGFIDYIPYSGVELTSMGLEQARSVLRKHRLWEVFLVGKLGYEHEEAHQTACQLEHATPDKLADLLEEYLERPPVNPAGEPIPGSWREDGGPLVRTLLTLNPGMTARISHISGQGPEQAFLEKNGLRSGADITLLAGDEGSYLVLVGEKRITLAKDVAGLVYIR